MASRVTSGAACFCEVRISGGVHQVVVDQVGTLQSVDFSRREGELSVISCCFSFLVTAPLDQDPGPWVVSKISHFGISV